FTLDSFRRDLECPRKDQHDWKTEYENGDKHFHHPRRRFEGWKENRCCLNQEPRHNCVGDRDLVNVAPPQLGEKVVDLHFKPAWSYRTTGSLLIGWRVNPAL